MNLKRLELLVDADYDARRLDKCKVIEQLSDTSYQRFCRHSAFTAQALVEQKKKNRRGVGNTLWFYDHWNKLPTIELNDINLD